MELWQETNGRSRSGEKGEALSRDRLDYLIMEETSSCEGTEEDAAINIKSSHRYLRKEPNFDLLSGVLRYIRDFTGGGDKMNVARQLDGAHVKLVCRSRSTGRPATLRNSEAIGKRRFRRDRHQLVYVVAQVNDRVMFSVRDGLKFWVILFQVKVRELLRFHRSRHQNRAEEETSIMDILSHGGGGVSSSHSSFGQERTFEVISGKFVGCRQLYTLAVGVAEEGFSDVMRRERVGETTLRQVSQSEVRSVRYTLRSNTLFPKN